MKRKLLVLNVALLVLIASAAWRLREQWREGRLREQKILSDSPGTSPPPVATPPQMPQPVTAATYGQIAQEMLFSQDRNPNVVVDVAPPKPLPPLPVAHGMVNFGGGPMVILSERPGAPHRTYSAGEKIGEFTLVAINNDGVVLEFDGREIKKSLQELRGSAEGQPPVQAEAVPPPQQAVTTVETVAQAPAQTTVETPSVQSGPGVVISGQVRACLPNDPSPPGTVIDGLRKLVNQTPFGKVCRWEPVE